MQIAEKRLKAIFKAESRVVNAANKEGAANIAEGSTSTAVSKGEPSRTKRVRKQTSKVKESGGISFSKADVQEKTNRKGKEKQKEKSTPTSSRKRATPVSLQKRFSSASSSSISSKQRSVQFQKESEGDDTSDFEPTLKSTTKSAKKDDSIVISSSSDMDFDLGKKRKRHEPPSECEQEEDDEDEQGEDEDVDEDEEVDEDEDEEDEDELDEAEKEKQAKKENKLKELLKKNPQLVKQLLANQKSAEARKVSKKRKRDKDDDEPAVRKKSRG